MTRLVRIVNPNELKPLHIVMLALLAFALAGNCLLTSGGKAIVLPDGANAWPSDSLLLAIVEILDLQYAQPTPNGIAIKSLVSGTAAGLGIIVAAIGILFRVRSIKEEADTDAVIEVDDRATSETSPANEDKPRKKHIDPILASQLLMLIYVAWAFAATLWSNAPSFAMGGAIVLSIHVLWSIALAISLNRRAAAISGYCLVGVLFITAVIACWYWYERNSVVRAQYPIGNPLFLAACLIPGMVVAVAFIGRAFTASRDKNGGRNIATIVMFLLACAVMAVAFHLTDSRGPKIGLGLGVFAVAAFAGGRNVKVVAATMGVIGVAVFAIFYINQLDTTSLTGRSASMRFRLYSWDYAMELFGEKPLQGHGLGGYALRADGLASQDVLADPEALGNRVSHAHSEWLETASDLGGIGLVLLVGSLFLAVYGGANAIPQIGESVPRWMLIGVSASLAALIAEECFSVGLQIAGLPFVFYTVLGLVWALARPLPASVPKFLAKRHFLGLGLSIVAIVLGCGAMEVSRQDFVAARSLYNVNQAIRDSDWQKAESLADDAYANRLRPQRKLVALIQCVATRLYIAEQLQVQYIRRLRIQGSGQSVDPGLVFHLQSDREKCQALLDKSLTDLEFIRSIVTSEMGVGLLDFKLRTLRAVFAEVDGRKEDVAQEGIHAAGALGAQLQRQPFETELATKFVIASIGRLAVEDALEVLARPLRFGIVTGEYANAVGVLLSNSETAAKAVERINQELVGLDGEVDLTKRFETWSPEILRVGAVGALVQGRQDESVAYLKAAVTLYNASVKAQRGVPLLAHAGSLAELADAMFKSNPESPDAAIKTAESSLRLSPPSREGRRLIAALRDRMMAYHLAANHEEFVRDRLKEQMPNADAKRLDSVVANRYARMSYSVLDRAYERIPYRLNAWSQRAIELDAESALNWFLAADISILVGSENRVVDSIRRAAETSGSPQDIYAIVLRASEAMPGSGVIVQLRSQIEQELGMTAPQDASTLPNRTSQPTEPNAADPELLPDVIDDSTTNSMP